MNWRERHLRAVARLERAATEVILAELDVILDGVVKRFAATTAAAGDEPAESAGSPDDLAGIPSQWVSAVDGTILPWYDGVFHDAASAAPEMVRETTGRTVPEGVDPELVDEAAVRHLASARNRFLAVGNTTWEKARAEMLAGFHAGEDVASVRRRLQGVTDLSRAAAESVARTEVIAASNAGAVTRVNLMGSDAPPYKQWLCVAADTRVWSPQPREIVKRRRPPGPLVRLQARSGDVLTVTPQHPVLTQRGWTAAHLVQQGDYLVRHRNVEAAGHTPPGTAGARRSGLGYDPHVDHPPPRADELHSASSHRWPDRRVVSRVMDLDCGGVDCEVEVVPTDGYLLADGETSIPEPAGEDGLVFTDVALGDLVASGAVTERLLAHAAPAVRPRHGGYAAGGHLGWLAPGAHDPGCASVSAADPGLVEPARHGLLGDLPGTGEMAEAVALGVALDEVTEIDGWIESGWHDVYDLSTGCGWFAANGFIVHNSTLDDRTRPSHAAADGQVVPRLDRFNVGLASLDYPGDPMGPPGETVQCRCSLLWIDEPSPIPPEGRGQGGVTEEVAPAVTADSRNSLPADGHWHDVTDADGNVHRLARPLPEGSVRYRQANGDSVIVSWLMSDPPACMAPTPNYEGCYCWEDGCGKPAAGRRRGAQAVWELVCADHLPAAAALHPGAMDVDGTIHTGSMIALIPVSTDAEHLALDGGEHVEALHVTLWFLGEAADMPPEFRAALRSEVEAAAARTPRLALKPGPFGAAVWNPAGDSPCLVYNVRGAGLEEARALFGAAVDAAEVAATPEGWEMPENHQPWVPHICAQYGGDMGAALAAMIDRVGEGEGVTLDRVRLTFGGDVIDIPLTGSQDVAVTAAAAGDAQEETAMPWDVRDGGEGCRYEVYNTETDERVACHDDPGSARDQVKALYANEDDAAAYARMVKPGKGGKCPPGFRPVGDRCIPVDSSAVPAGNYRLRNADGVYADTEVTAAAKVDLTPRPGEHWHAVMHVQGVSTGKRTFKNLGWREPPFAFHWQRSSSAHGGQPEVVQTGLTLRVVPEGDILHAFGNLDLGSDVGREHGRQMVAGFSRWVSIGLDEQPTNITVDWPDDVDDADPASLFAEPEQITFDGGRIGELSAVSVPAQDEATVEPTPELIALMEGEEVEPMVTAASATPEPEEASAPARTEPHPEMTGEDFADAVQGLTAAAWSITIAEVPPAWWFERPEDVDVTAAFNVTEEGRIYGALAPMGVGHRAFANSGRRLEVPMGNVDYARFMGGWALTSRGRIAAGPVTMDCGHADRFRADHQVAPAHYENACTIVAKIRVGEDRERGIVWAAGALEPGVTPDELSRMLACRLSGDWQPHSDRSGWQELIAALLVPSPGFPMEHRGPQAEFEQGVLVASSVPVRAVGKTSRPTLRVDMAKRRVTRVTD